MRKLVLGLVAASAIALSSAASATALVLTNGSTTTITPPDSAIFGNTFGNATTPATIGGFSDTYSFILTGAASTDASLVTFLLNHAQNIDFGCPTCSVYIDTNDATHAFVQTGSTPEVWALLSPITLDTGVTHTLYVNGTILSGPTASYSGTINWQPVPEPATWAMMLLGFGGIGFAMRRRRRPALAQVA